MTGLNKLADILMAKANDDVKYGPICYRQITQYIITSKWQDVGIFSCGWTSFGTPVVVPHQSKFYLVSRRQDMEQTIDLLATFPSKEKHRGRKMFKDHTSCIFYHPPSHECVKYIYAPSSIRIS